MRRIWLAALLGIALGVGLGVAPGSTALHERVFMQPSSVEALPKLGAAQATSWQSFQPILVGLMAGMMLGVLAFFTAKRRTR
jgi:ABC-type nitrate/sulfonate/bicarbonate transport system permease component